MTRPRTTTPPRPMVPTAAATAHALHAMPITPAERHTLAGRAALERRRELDLYAALYAERHGIILNLATLHAGDDLLADLTILALT